MGKSVMVFAPHQDDEALHCAGVLRRAAQAGEEICVCYATNGEYEGEEQASVRAGESLSVLQMLGVPAHSAVFLGYPDTGMPPRESFFYRLFEDSGGAQLPSRWGRTETWLPDGRREYRFLKDGTHSPHTRAAVLRDLTELLAERLPDEIFVTAPGDKHGDHAALGAFVAEAVRGTMRAQPQWTPQLYFYLVHAGDEAAWPPRETDTFPEPAGSAALGLSWQAREVRPLPEGFTAQDKRALLMQYASQDPHAYGDYLLAFAKGEELFFPQNPQETVKLPPLL